MSVDSLHHHPTTTTNFQLVCCCVLIIFAKTITNIQLLSIVTSQGLRLRLRPYLCRIWTLESGDGGGVVSHGGCCFRGDSVDSGVPGSKESISEM